MEAKGCAKPAVWKDARKFFYWALRSKLVRSTYIQQILAASPSTSRAEANDLLFSLIAPTTNLSDNRAIAEAFEALDLESTLNELHSDEIARQVTEFIRSPNRKAALAGLVNAAQLLTDDEKAILQSALGSASNSSPGLPTSPAIAKDAR
jgi:acetyl-CoA carboxylase / biotin carboxylase 1